MNSKQTLLPTGFYDVLGTSAATEYRALGTVMDALDKLKYQYVRPPLMEFEDSLVNKADTELAKQTFRVMDPESGNMLGLRADMTPQIARIAETRLQDAPRPLRLAYSGQVVRATQSGVSATRQWTQAGFERIGAGGIEAETDAINTAISILKTLGISGLTVDISLPTLFNSLTSGLDNVDQLQKLVKDKDIDNINALNQQYDVPNPQLDTILQLLNLAGDATTALQQLTALDLPAAAAQNVADTRALVAALQAANIDATITIDPLEHHGFNYYTGIAFAIFTSGAQAELGRGGRYALPTTGEAAVGFSFHMNTISALLDNS